MLMSKAHTANALLHLLAMAMNQIYLFRTVLLQWKNVLKSKADATLTYVEKKYAILIELNRL